MTHVEASEIASGIEEKKKKYFSVSGLALEWSPERLRNLQPLKNKACLDEDLSYQIKH